MKSPKSLLIMSFFIALLSLVAAGAGVFGQGQGQPVPFTNVRGDPVMLYGHGLYRYDSLSAAAQAQGGDVVTLLLCVPLLLVSTLSSARGSMRGRLLLTGTLGYFLYTYASLALLLAYNPLFLLYVAIFSLSLFAFVFSLVSMGADSLPARFSSSTPRLPVAAFLFLLAAFLIMNWIGRIILPSLLTGATPEGLDSYSTLVIQTLDLGIVVPAAFLCGVLWLKRSAYGYLLAPVLLVKGLTMSSAITAMIVGMKLAGVHVSAVEVLMFPLIGLLDAGLMVWVLKSVDGKKHVEPALAQALPNPSL